MTTAEIKETFEFLHLHENCLSINQIDFMKSLKRYFNKHGSLTERQERTLFEMKKFLIITR